MNRFTRLLQNYLIFVLPFVIALILWQGATPTEGATGALKWLADGLAWNLMLWFAALAVFLLLLVFSGAARDRTLKRLASLQERDEREQFITGRAARTAYISSISVLIFLLFFAIFSLNVTRHEAADAAGHHGNVSIGLEFKFLDPPAETHNAEGTIVDMNGLPLSKPALILLLLIWQLAAFRLAAHRQMKADA